MSSPASTASTSEHYPIFTCPNPPKTNPSISILHDIPSSPRADAFKTPTLATQPTPEVNLQSQARSVLGLRRLLSGSFRDVSGLAFAKRVVPQIGEMCHCGVGRRNVKPQGRRRGIGLTGEGQDLCMGLKTHDSCLCRSEETSSSLEMFNIIHGNDHLLFTVRPGSVI